MIKIIRIVGFVVLFFFHLISSNAQICPKSAGTELITNGNFSGGNTGFASDYIYSFPTASINNYSVGSNPNSMNSYYAAIGDHTSGTGNLMVIDVDGTLGKDVYRTNVTVLASTTYFFSAWFANINDNASYFASNGKYENSPLIKFSINGAQVGTTVRVDSTNHNWRQFFVAWNSGAVSGPITIRIENLQPGNGGNDLGLDDISFSTSCANIGNLASLGKSSTLPDTVSTCNVAFPYVLNPVLGAGYGFNWKNSGGTSLGTANTFSVATAPANGTKYYLCYDTIAGCPRTDSVIFISQFKVELGPNKVRCAPINEVLSSGVATPPATVQWSLNGTAIPAGSGGTASTYTATAAGTYRVDVSRAGCGTAFDIITIGIPPAGFSGSGTYCVGPNISSFSVTGSPAVKWYTTASGGTPLNPGNSNPTISPAYTATNTSIPGCASGLFAEDISSFNGSVGASSSSPPCTGTGGSGNASSMMFTVYQNLTLNSIDIIQPGYGYSGTANFTVNIYSNNPTGGPYNGGCGCNLNTKGTLLFTSANSSYPLPSLATIRTLAVGASLTGIAAGTVYWLEITTDQAYTYFNCAGAFPYTESHNVLTINKSYNYGNETTNYGNALNWNFTAGNVYSCGRVFVCATQDCSAPVELVNFTAALQEEDVILEWTTASEQNNSHFILERSVDGENFISIGRVEGKGNNASIQSYRYLDTTFSGGQVYYRLVQYDFDGSPSYSDVQKISSTSIESVELYPNPFENNITLIVHSPQKEKIQFKLYSIIGTILYQNEEHYSNEKIVLGENLSKGIYIVAISQGGKIKNFRVIKGN